MFTIFGLLCTLTSSWCSLGSVGVHTPTDANESTLFICHNLCTFKFITVLSAYFIILICITVLSVYFRMFLISPRLYSEGMLDDGCSSNKNYCDTVHTCVD